MPDTIREQILTAFATKIGAERCDQLDGRDVLPAKSLWDNREEAEGKKYGVMQMSLPLAVEYKAQVDPNLNISKQANAMLGELIQLATDGDNTLAGLCESISYQQSEFNYPEDGTQVIEVYVEFSVIYKFAKGDPFTLA